MHRSEVVQSRRIDGRGGEEQPAHHVLRHQPRQVRRRAERAALDLGQPERRVVGRDDDVCVADQALCRRHAESVDGRDHRHRALVHRAERGEAAAVGVDKGGIALSFSLSALHLLDVDAGIEAAACRPKDHDTGLLVLAGLGDGVGELEPACARESR